MKVVELREGISIFDFNNIDIACGWCCYIDETISSNLRLIEFVSSIFLMNGIDNLTFEERLVNSIKKVRNLDIQEVRDFANIFIKNMNEYIFVESLNGGKI